MLQVKSTISKQKAEHSQARTVSTILVRYHNKELTLRVQISQYGVQLR